MDMMELRRAQDRGHADHGWLNSWHSFSFADYYDPKHVQFRALRVINDDTVEPGRGFGTHGHRDMEIVSYVLNGALAHKDSMGNGSVIHPGNVQRMSAGTGVQHSEFNPSQTEKVHFLQIWFLPNAAGINPSYEEKYFSDEEKRGRLRLIASPDGADGSVKIHADAKMFAVLLDGNEQVEHPLAQDRYVYVHVAGGDVALNDTPLHAGDGAMLAGGERVMLAQGRNAEVLVFELT
jgi:redox-sensitive bicupin YhaK (pirin superfamily)